VMTSLLALVYRYGISGGGLSSFFFSSKFGDDWWVSILHFLAVDGLRFVNFMGYVSWLDRWCWVLVREGFWEGCER